MTTYPTFQSGAFIQTFERVITGVALSPADPMAKTTDTLRLEASYPEGRLFLTLSQTAVQELKEEIRRIEQSGHSR